MESFVIDFTNKNRRKKTYAGANGNKISVIHQDKLYMLKSFYKKFFWGGYEKIHYIFGLCSVWYGGGD